MGPHEARCGSEQAFELGRTQASWACCRKSSLGSVQAQPGRCPTDPPASHGAKTAGKSIAGTLRGETGSTATAAQAAHAAPWRRTMTISVSEAARILEGRGALGRRSKNQAAWVIDFVAQLIRRPIPADLA